MNRTKIEWVKNPDGTQGYTWNPITGCLNGCEYCYARRLANGRLKSRYLGNRNIAPPDDLPEYQVPLIENSYPELLSDTAIDYERAFADPFYPRFWDRKIKTMVHSNTGRRKPRGVFVCDMSDLFGIGIPEEWTRRVLDVCQGNWQDRFYLLTKQPQNLAKFSPFPDNCWVGVTITDNDAYYTSNDVLDKLKYIKAKVKYISFEPLLERIWAGGSDGMYSDLKDAGIKWVIIGAQTKPYKPPKIEWVEEIVRACDKAGVAVFLKDNLEPLFKPLMRVPNMSWWGNVFGLRQEMPR